MKEARREYFTEEEAIEEIARLRRGLTAAIRVCDAAYMWDTAKGMRARVEAATELQNAIRAYSKLDVPTFTQRPGYQNGMKKLEPLN